jgi:repressor of nif and glnA expression
MTFSPDSVDVERKIVSILRVLQDANRSLGSTVIAESLKEGGVELSERAVRYHLKLMDERGLTIPQGRNGRLITESGTEELNAALVRDKVGFVISRIEGLAFQTSFDPDRRTGLVPVNVSFFAEKDFPRAVRVMQAAFRAGFGVSQLVCLAHAGETIGDVVVPPGSIGLATVCSIVVNGVLLGKRIPMDSRFGAILQMRHGQPVRFTDLINYDGSSLDPSEVFIQARMTEVNRAVNTGNGRILANYREIPGVCRPLAEEVLGKLAAAGMGGLVVMGNPSEPVCEVPVELNRVGIVLQGGLNPVAATREMGTTMENRAMSTLVEYDTLADFDEVANGR